MSMFTRIGLRPGMSYMTLPSASQTKYSSQYMTVDYRQNEVQVIHFNGLPIHQLIALLGDHQRTERDRLQGCLDVLTKNLNQLSDRVPQATRRPVVERAPEEAMPKVVMDDQEPPKPWELRTARIKVRQNETGGLALQKVKIETSEGEHVSISAEGMAENGFDLSSLGIEEAVLALFTELLAIEPVLTPAVSKQKSKGPAAPEMQEISITMGTVAEIHVDHSNLKVEMKIHSTLSVNAKHAHEMIEKVNGKHEKQKKEGAKKRKAEKAIRKETEEMVTALQAALDVVTGKNSVHHDEKKRKVS